jgi:hypothetical protein
VTVIPGEGRVPILYGNQAMAAPPHHTGYLARPDAVDRHPAVAITAGAEPTAGIRTLARHLARYGYGAVVPPGSRVELTAAVDALGGAWSEWSHPDRRAVVGVGLGAEWAIGVAGERRLPLVLIVPSPTPSQLPGSVPVLVVGTDSAPGSGVLSGHWVTYRGIGTGFWDDASPDYSVAPATDCLARLVGFLDRHLGVAAAA